MEHKDVSRRDFTRLAAAAVGGMMAVGGIAAASEKKGAKAAGSTKAAAPAAGEGPVINVDPGLLLQDKNVCRGLNACKTEGKGEHVCAGQGSCATAVAHSCNTMNECKGQGGCGGYPGQNTCSGKGHCAVPLKQSTWDLARKQFEQLMKDNDKMVGAAPAA
ncbi:hypothetical protein GC163_24395 [bacterium]|nr:hypothetical protein [bacterium]